MIGSLTAMTSALHGTSYTVDSALVGKALTKGVAYPIFGTAITMSTGDAMLIRYAP